MTPRTQFWDELKELRQDIVSMGTEVEALVEKTIKVITEKDTSLAQEVIVKEQYIDYLEVEIERKCVELIAKQHPVAKDLRFVMSIIKMATDMERIADQCEDICEYSLRIEDDKWTKEDTYKRHIERMATDVLGMLKDTVDSLVNKDIGKLKEVCAYDDKIDADFRKIWQEIIEEMNENQEFVNDGPHYIMIIKYFERIADHTTNIAEWLIYNVTGEYNG